MIYFQSIDFKAGGTPRMRTLQRLKITNFKSIREQDLTLGPLNLFIGGNGAGKSNLIEVFRFLNEIVHQNLAGYVDKKEGADALVRHGRKASPSIQFDLEFGEEEITNGYCVTLGWTSSDSLYIAKEIAFYHQKEHYPEPYEYLIPSDGKESGLRRQTHITAKQILQDLESYRVFHFHDTSDSAPAKGKCDIDDNRFFRPQAENLAAFLYYLQERKPDHFRLIEDTVRQIAPFFDRFVLAPLRLNPQLIQLEWRERGSDAYFNAASLSDGTLRFICLATLLLQPDLPPLVLIDEPELGLHPAAIHLLADMLASAATRTQVLVATQSVTLINQFTPEEVWAVDREQGESIFRQLSCLDRSDWLEDYALGELWEKNLLGARP